MSPRPIKHANKTVEKHLLDTMWMVGTLIGRKTNKSGY